jgi:hypothetical protein
MSVNAHLIKHRFFGSVASLIHPNEKRVPFSIPLDWSCGLFGHRMMVVPRKGCVLVVRKSKMCSLCRAVARSDDKSKYNFVKEHRTWRSPLSPVRHEIGISRIFSSHLLHRENAAATPQAH